MFQYLVQESPDPLALLHPLDISGRIIYANNAFLRLLGHPPEKLINTCVLMLFCYSVCLCVCVCAVVVQCVGAVDR